MLEFKVPMAGQTGFWICTPPGGLGPPCTNNSASFYERFSGMPTAGFAPYRFGLERPGFETYWFGQGTLDLSHPLVIASAYQY